LTALNCTSCHANPPNGAPPAGAAYANIAGAHAVHLALDSAGSPVSCNTCHNGLGTNTLNHYDRAKSRVPPGDVAFLATYNAETGASSWLPSVLTCTNVSCHGGSTPNWQTGAINVNAACTLCHSQGTAQFNSYNSGEHQKHVVGESLSCTVCHNTTTLAVNHFTTLSTTAMEGPASATIGGTGTSVTSYSAGSCTPQGGVGCHETRTW
jgi:predicted CxxxxCH...CXXCH cytochrome family protein